MSSENQNQTLNHSGNGEANDRCLTSSAALKVLVNDLEAAVARFYEQNKRTPKSILKLIVLENPFSFWPNIVYTFLVTLLAVVVFVVSTDSWFLIEALLFFVVICLNCCFVAIDSVFTREEYAKKVSRLAEYLKTVDETKLTCCDLKNIEFFPSSSVVRVVRDDRFLVVPDAVIVRGDILVLLPGERPPCSATYLPEFSSPVDRHCSSATGSSMDSGLKASDLLSDRTSVIPYPSATYYKLNETPIVLQIQEKLFTVKQHVPPPILRLIYAVRRWQFFIVVPITIAFSAIFIVLISFLHGYSTVKGVICDLFPFIIHSVYAISIPFLPTMLTILRVHGNALIVDESKRLLSTRNERADSGADEAYEHVEIIKPTELFTQSKMLVFRDLLLGRLPDSLPRNGNILFGFANLNYLCAIDKEGVLSCPRPVLQKLLIFSSAPSQCPGAPGSLSSGPHSASSSTMPRNVSFGAWSSDTVSSAQGKHCRLETLHAITRIQDGGLCLDFDEKQWFRHLGVLKALGLNMVVTSSQLYTDRYRSFVSYLNSPFFRSIVDSPTGIVPPTTAGIPAVSSVASHLDVVNMHTFTPLTERIGFRTEQTLSNYKVEEFVGIYTSSFPSPLRRAFATVCRDVTNLSMGNSLQLFCQGHPDLILAMCSDFWDGTDLHPFTPGIRARIKDFCSRSSQTGYCVALSYAPLSQPLRPLNTDACLRFVPKNEFPPSASASPMLASSAHNLAPRWADFIEDGNQIFIGVAVLQSQPLMPVIQLVQNLKMACSRFVYFSREGELMSRAFAEKLGLEANWNCFISLADSKDQHSGSSNQVENQTDPETDETVQLLPGGKPPGITQSISCAPGMTQGSSLTDSSHSASPTNDSGNPTKRQRQTSTASGAPVISIKTSSSAPNLSLFCLGENGELAPSSTGRISPSGLNVPTTENSNTGDELSSHASADSMIVIENRAQLPRGIKEVRPHIAQCDNVPLLVSLFTDCSRHAAGEMMSIMAENNGVVCSLGSSLAVDNFSSFAATDCAVSVFPLAPPPPHQYRPSPSSGGGSFILTGSSSIHNITPSQQFSAALAAGLQQQARDIYSDIASRLTSLPCSLTIRPNRICHLLQLLAQCRHYVACIKQVFFFAVFAYATMLFAHFAHLLADRPLPISPLQFMWLSVFAIPLLSSSLITAPIDENILTQPPHRARVTSATVAGTVCYFLATFLPAVPLCLSLTVVFDYLVWKEYSGKPVPFSCSISHGGNEFSGDENNGTENFTLLFPDSYQFIPPWYRIPQGLPSNCWIDRAFSENFVVLSSELSSLFLGLYILLLSSGFLFPLASVWRQNPVKLSRPFAALFFATIFGTILLAVAHIFAATLSADSSPSFRDVSTISWCLAIFLPVLIALPAHELFKLRRKRKIVRQLKRIRLEFNTRLGLNSPF